MYTYAHMHIYAYICNICVFCVYIYSCRNMETSFQLLKRKHESNLLSLCFACLMGV